METFYTYLGGPRTFGGNNLIIRNNYFAPLPFYYGGYQGCNCGSNMNNIFGMLMLNSFITNSFAQINGAKNDYYQPHYPSNSPEYEPARETRTQKRDQVKELRKFLDSQGFSEVNGFTLSKDKNGRILITYNKDGIKCSGYTLQEVLGQISSKSERVEDVDDNDRIDLDDDDDDDDDIDDEGDNQPVLATLENNEHMWVGIEDLPEDIQAKINEGTRIRDIAKLLIPEYPTLSQEEKNKILDKLKKANPTAIQNGKVVDLEQLNIIATTTDSPRVETTNGYAYTVKADIHKVIYYKKNEAGKYIICTAEEFKRQCKTAYANSQAALQAS